MSNTITRRLMVPAVLLIWAVVILRFLDGCSTTTTHSVSESQNFLAFHSSVVPDSFSLKLNYEDPFLRGEFQAEFSANNFFERPSRKQFEPSIGKASNINFPKIHYLGGIKSPDSDKMTGIIKLDGKTFSVAPGDQIEEVLIQKIQLEEVTVRVNDSIIIVPI